MNETEWLEIERQEHVVLAIARKTLAHNTEVAAGETIDGRYIFHLWFPDVERNMSVHLSDDETILKEYIREKDDE